jgi:hypothetical protein
MLAHLPQEWTVLATWRLVSGMCRDRARRRWRQWAPDLTFGTVSGERFRLLRNHLLPSFILIDETLNSFVQLENCELPLRNRGYKARVCLHEARVCFGHLSQNLKKLLHL